MEGTQGEETYRMQPGKLDSIRTSILKRRPWAGRELDLIQ